MRLLYETIPDVPTIDGRPRMAKRFPPESGKRAGLPSARECAGSAHRGGTVSPLFFGDRFILTGVPGAAPPLGPGSHESLDRLPRCRPRF